VAEQKTGNMVFSIVEGGEFVATFPHPLTLETVEELEQQLAIVVRGLRRTALQQQEKADGEAEYASWLPVARVEAQPLANAQHHATALLVAHRDLIEAQADGDCQTAEAPQPP
jgi:hypothetical protein